MIPWKPRASKMGLYASCPRASYLDKLIHENPELRPNDGEYSSSAYADLGTLIHDALQTRLGCVMQTRLTESMQPLRDNAASLYSNPEALEAAIASNVEWAASIFPAAPDGKAWVAEPEGETASLTGHLDFESQDGSAIIDLKTTARKPDNKRMKPLHLAQVVSYWTLRGRKAKWAKILYLDSTKGAWAILTDKVDFTNPFVQEYADNLNNLSYDIMNEPRSMAVPGDHCKSGFCSYRNSKLCYASLIPPGESSELFENSGKPAPNPFQGPKTAKVKLW